MPRIEPVRLSDRERALGLLVGAPSLQAAQAASAFARLLDGPEARRCAFWWARTLRGFVAAALVVRNPGRTGMIFNSPADRSGSARAALVALLGQITAAVLADDLTFVQALLPVERAGDAAAYAEAGYSRLARLRYMTRLLDEPIPPIAGELNWREFAPGDESALGAVIADTYAGSLDCPPMLGRRPMADVILSHRNAGVFRPQTWWMPTLGGQPIGCVLVNGAGGEPDLAEIVYLGVRPPFRRKGFGAAMLRHALVDAAARGQRAVRLAVDAANHPAVALYAHERFVETDRRDVHVRYAAGTRG